MNVPFWGKDSENFILPAAEYDRVKPTIMNICFMILKNHEIYIWKTLPSARGTYLMKASFHSSSLLPSETVAYEQ